MRALALSLVIMVAAGTAGCDALIEASGSCLYNSCGCLSGAFYAETRGDPSQQSVSLVSGETYVYDTRDFVYVYRADGRDCVADRSTRYAFQVEEVDNSDPSVVMASVTDGFLELAGVSQGTAQVRIRLIATGLTDIGSAQEGRVLTADVTVAAPMP